MSPKVNAGAKFCRRFANHAPWPIFRGWGACKLAAGHLKFRSRAGSGGLSHMSKEFEEELFAPSGEFHFSCDGAFVWVGVQDVDSHSSDDGEVLWRVVLARSRVILVEDHVERPM